MNWRSYFPFLDRPRGSLPRGEMLALRPLRNKTVAWTMPTAEEMPGARLTVPRLDDPLGRILGRVFQLPATKTIELDEFGAAVWEKCDGRHTVEQLVGFTSSAYTLNRRQAEVSVVTFLRMLAQRRLIGLDSKRLDLRKETADVLPRTERRRAQTKHRSRRRH